MGPETVWLLIFF